MGENRRLPVWRSMMFVPVNVDKFVDSAHTRGADVIILDLEDSILPKDKERARTLVAAAAPVYDIDQFMADPHVKARGIVVDVPDKDMGTIPMHAVVPRLSASPGALRRPAPELGEHTAEVLGRLGVDGAARQDLSRRKII